MPKTELVGVLDNIRSLYNVGSMFRTADAFGLGHLYLCGITGAPDSDLQRARISKTSLGAEQTVPWTQVERTIDAIRTLQERGYVVISLEQTPRAKNLFTVHRSLFTSDRLAIVVGHELHGVHADTLNTADYHVMIPMLGTKESLNVAVAFGIACAQLRK